jgi:DNA-binding MarR family transcriptional regulator
MWFLDDGSPWPGDRPMGTKMTRRPPADRWRHDNVGRLLNNALARFESRVLELMSRSGHPDARISHIALTRNLDLGGTRVSELARRAGMTKQAMGELVGQCAELGLVVASVDPSDKRARVVTFTPDGLRWLEAFRQAVDRTEEEMREEVGAMSMDVLRGALALYGSGFDTLANRKPDAT